MASHTFPVTCADMCVLAPADAAHAQGGPAAGSGSPVGDGGEISTVFRP